MTRIAKHRGTLAPLLFMLVLSLLVVNVWTKQASSQTPPASQSVQHSPTTPFVWTGNTSPSGSGYTTPFAVPTGKRLVIEQVSSSGLLGGGEKPWGVGIQFNHGPTRVTFLLSLHESAGVATGAGYEFTMSQALRLYADSGSVRFFVDDNANGVRQYYFALSGYLVDAGIPPK